MDTSHSSLPPSPLRGSSPSYATSSSSWRTASSLSCSPVAVALSAQPLSAAGVRASTSSCLPPSTQTSLSSPWPAIRSQVEDPLATGRPQCMSSALPSLPHPHPHPHLSPSPSPPFLTSHRSPITDHPRPHAHPHPHRSPSPLPPPPHPGVASRWRRRWCCPLRALKTRSTIPHAGPRSRCAGASLPSHGAYICMDICICMDTYAWPPRCAGASIPSSPTPTSLPSCVRIS